MDIVIRNNGETPIYDQIMQQIKAAILSGELAQGEMLPSMRLLARELRISVITTKRAYEELERDGYIYTVGGKGSFAAKKNDSLIREEYLRKIEEHLLEIQRLAAVIRLSEEDLDQMIETIREVKNERG